MKLKIYQNSLIVALIALALLNIYFIVRTAMLFPTVESIQDNIILLICLLVLLAMLVMDVINTFVSKTKGSTFIKPLAFDDDTTVNTKFIVFCYIFGVISIGVIIYFILILSGVQLFFSTFPRPLAYLIVNLFSLTLLACVAIILFPYVGRGDISFKKKNRK
ncbi:MAG: hypothetical protein E7175_04975 [Erysipelotrichaceae bacterium]|nr:hypothetical protein [Erysipelotrichaceae bacterium]